MPAISAELRRKQARHAAAVRWNKPNTLETGRDLVAATLEEHIRRTLAAAPPLTPAQRASLRDILGGGA